MVTRFLGKFLKIYIVVFLAFAIVATIVSLTYNPSPLFMKVIFLALALISFVGLSILAVKLFEKSRVLFFTLLIVVSAGACIGWGLFANTMPVSDYAILMKAGKDIANGSFVSGFFKEDYFYMYNYQIGYAAFLGFFMWISDNSLLVLKAIEIILISASALLVFGIMKKLSGEIEACVAAVIYAAFIPTILGSSIINNQHLSAFLMLLGVYFILKMKLPYIALGAAFIALMNVARPVGIIIFVAVVVFFLGHMIKTRKIIVFLRNCGVFAAVFLILIVGMDALMINMRFTPSAISKPNLPYYKFVKGLGDSGGSIFGNTALDSNKTEVYFDLKIDNFNYDAYNTQSIEYLKHRITDVGTMGPYIYRKMFAFLGEPDHQYTFALTESQQASPISKDLVNVGQIQYLLLLFLALYSVFRQFKSSDNRFILVLIALATFLSVYVVIEVQTRYRYECYLLLMLLAANSLGGYIKMRMK